MTAIVPTQLPEAGRMRRAQKITAAVARFVSPTEPSEFAVGLRAVSGVLDGYVHGAYTPSMELYDPDLRAFRVRGNAPTSYIGALNGQVAIHTMRALTVIALAAHDRGLKAVAAMLTARKDAYETSQDYQSLPS